ncbi:uncharacterized protein LOC141586089 [Silene latifolia]|uniref:uncharacterized protein LOC141586089 n=1 Tax=Silene latifolia TaxID=37657 RepID=UPI003D777D79
MTTTRRGLTESTRSTTAIPEKQAAEEENVEEQVREDDDEDEEDEDEEKLQEEVAEMAKKLQQYRSTLPEQLKSTLSSLLASQRPPLSLSSHASSSGASPGPHLLPGPESCSENPNKELAAGDGEKTAEEIKLLNEKISNNISAMPKVLKRMNECISRLDKLISSNETIHPAYKRKKS